MAEYFLIILISAVLFFIAGFFIKHIIDKKSIEAASSKIGSIKKEAEEKTEEIMRGVKRCKIFLFDPENAQWTTSWSKKMQHLPSMIKLQITEKDQQEVLEMAFPLPDSQEVITLS